MLRPFTAEAWNEDLDRPTSFPPERDKIKELLEDDEAMSILEELVKAARNTRDFTAKTLLEEWEQVVENNKSPYGWLNK